MKRNDMVMFIAFMMMGMLLVTLFQNKNNPKKSPLPPAPGASTSAAGTATGTAAAGAAGFSSGSQMMAPAATGSAQLPDSEITSPQQLIDASREAYASYKNYSYEFDMVQLLAPKETPKDELDKLRNVFKVDYLKDEKPGSDNYWLRFHATEGIHKKTFVTRVKNGSGEFVFMVYKPAIPNGVETKSDDPRMRDIPRMTFTEFLINLEDLGKTLGSKVSVTYDKTIDKYILEIITETVTPGALGSKRSFLKYTTLFDHATKLMTYQEVREQKGANFVFKSRKEWRNFAAAPQLTKEYFLQKPDFTKE